MTAIVLPNIDQATLDGLRRRLPSLSEIEIPSLEIPSIEIPSVDRLLGRSRPPIWPWVAFGVILVAVLGSVAAWATWSRRPSWTRRRDPWAADPSTDAPPTADRGMDVEIATGEGPSAPGGRLDEPEP